MHHIAAIQAAADKLQAMGYDTETPNVSEASVDYTNLSDDERAVRKQSLIREHLNKISGSDAVFIYNEAKNNIDGYIGGNSLMEMAFAYAQGIEIFLWKPIPDIAYQDEIAGMQPIVIDGNLAAIDEYYKQLPLALISSDSPIKLRAVSRGMRRAGIWTHVKAMPTESNVSEQPQTTAETYEGASNRQMALRKAVTDTELQPAYLVSIEGGLCRPFHDRNVYSSTVVIIEKTGDSPKVGYSVEVEYPKSMTDKVPSVYPDLGVLVQKEYGSALKDPFPYITNGHVSRLQLIETAVFDVASQI